MKPRFIAQQMAVGCYVVRDTYFEEDSDYAFEACAVTFRTLEACQHVAFAMSVEFAQQNPDEDDVNDPFRAALELDMIEVLRASGFSQEVATEKARKILSHEPSV